MASTPTAMPKKEAGMAGRAERGDRAEGVEGVERGARSEVILFTS
jgi:hypothetical protein